MDGAEKKSHGRLFTSTKNILWLSRRELWEMTKLLMWPWVTALQRKQKWAERADSALSESGASDACSHDQFHFYRPDLKSLTREFLSLL